MKENYRKNCDIMRIDATYNTNKYLLPLATFIGISNDGKLVTFGNTLIFLKFYF